MIELTKRRKVGLLLWSIVLGVFGGISECKTVKKTNAGTGVMTGLSLFKYGHTCIFFRVFFISDDFFTGLKAKKKAAKPLFEKNGRQYDNFPDELLVDIEARLHECPIKYGQIMPPDYGSSLIEGASFETYWKDAAGENSRRATMNSTNMLHQPGLKWDYLLKIRSADVPLSSILDIDMSLRGGIAHAHLSADLIKSQ